MNLDLEALQRAFSPVDESHDPMTDFDSFRSDERFASLPPERLRVLRKVTLWGEEFEMGVEAVVAQLRHCQLLTTLELGDNSLGPEGAKALAAQLPHCQQLTTLDLW